MTKKELLSSIDESDKQISRKQMIKLLSVIDENDKQKLIEHINKKNSELFTSKLKRGEI